MRLLLQEIEAFANLGEDVPPPEPQGARESQWDHVDGSSADQRPAMERIRVEQERRRHILEGDVTGGGHRSGTGRPGKSEFPPSWMDDQIIRAAMDVAAQPDLPPTLQGNGR